MPLALTKSSPDHLLPFADRQTTQWDSGNNRCAGVRTMSVRTPALDLASGTLTLPRQYLRLLPILRVQVEVRILRNCPVKLRADDRDLVGVIRLPEARQLLGTVLGQVLNGLD